MIEPGEMHDGQADSVGGFAYTMLYLPQAWLWAGLAEIPSRDPAFRTTLADDARLGSAIRTARNALARPVPTAGSRRSAGCGATAVASSSLPS
jgi:hypothetical protein